MLESAMNDIVSHINKSTARNIGGLIIVGAAGYVVTEIVKGIKRQVDLSHHQDIHAHHDTQTGKITVNADGKGHKIAEIHKGDNGKFYKWFAGRWHMWDGENWQRLSISA